MICFGGYLVSIVDVLGLLYVCFSHLEKST
jgi:hypothetical protein